MDLVEEEDLALLEGGEDRGQVARVLDGGPGGDADRGAHLGGDDHGEGGLAEAGGAGEQYVVGGRSAGAGGAQDEVELFADLLLADELAQVLGAQGGLDGLVLAVGDGAHQPLLGGGGVGGVVPVHGVCLGVSSGLRRWAGARAAGAAAGVSGLC